MTQQELFDKLKQLLKPAGYHMRLMGSWRCGEVFLGYKGMDVFAHCFSHHELLDDVTTYLKYQSTRALEGEEVDAGLLAFLHVFKAALDTFPEEERVTDYNYRFNQALFDYLKETLAADNIEVSFEEFKKDERHSSVIFKLSFPNHSIMLFSIFGRCFDLEGMEREVEMTTQDLEYLRHGERPEYRQALNRIYKRLQQYREKLMLQEVELLLNGSESNS